MSLSDDRRLVFAAVPVCLLFSLLLGPTASGVRPDLLLFAAMDDPKAAPERLYHVLVEQIERAPDTDRRQIRAWSDVDASGTGYLTEKQGFHTLTPHDSLSLRSNAKAEKKTGASDARDAVSSARDAAISAPDGVRERETGGSVTRESGEYRIPSNYRFRKDFALRYDGSGNLSLARRELPGFEYFQDMLAQIRMSFAPPGLNFAYHDRAGLVVSQQVKPQTVKVLFLLDESGRVRDVRRVSSLGQEAVDEACLGALRGQNFGPPPPEVFSEGNIFGINFVFPDISHR